MVADGEVAAARDDLRATVQRMRGSASPRVVDQASGRAARLLGSIHGVRRARTVAVHEPSPGDLDPQRLVPELEDRGVRVLLLADDLRTPAVLSVGRGHLATADHGPDLMAMIEAVVLPGVAFDLDGGRLGDVDDRWTGLLRHLDEGALRIGLARTAQLVPRVPRTDDDVVVDVVVTDRAVHHTGARLGPRDA